MLRNGCTFGLLTSLLTCMRASLATPSCEEALFPNIADSTHSTPETASFFHDYFTAKSKHDAEAWVSFFNSDQTYYFDAAVGGGSPNYTDWAVATKHYTDSWRDGAVSYPVRVLGDLTHGAVVQFTDTAEIFGSELRIIAAVDFQEDKVARQIDYWDDRGTDFIKERVPNSRYDRAIGLSSVEVHASPIIQQVAKKLQECLSTANGSAAAQLFSCDGVLEEHTLRARLEGQKAIGEYLERVLEDVPYGPGAKLRHVLGTKFGGGYEWSAGNTTMDVLNGIVALELDETHLINRCTIVWESSRVEKETIRGLAERSVM